MPAFAVDSHPDKAKIIEGILAGRSVRSIAASVSPPLDFNAIQRYKANVVKPVVRRAEYENRILLGEKRETVPLSTDPKAIQTTQQALQDAPTLSIFRQRLEKLHGRIDRSLDKAEAAVRVERDEDGNEIFAGPDLSPIAPLLNQAHKNLEILGRATGELEPQGGQGVSIQIIVPSAIAAASGELPRVTFGSQGVIEGKAEEVEEGMSEIGVLQRPE